MTELMVGVVIGSLLGIIASQFLSHMRGVAEPAMTGRIVLQMEARRAADNMIEIIRQGSEVVTPGIGETASFLTFKNLENHTCLLYLDVDEEKSRAMKRPLFKLVLYRDEYSDQYSPQNEKVIVEMVKSANFTCISPDSVQIDAVIANEKAEYQFITHVGLMNIGDEE